MRSRGVLGAFWVLTDLVGQPLHLALLRLEGRSLLMCKAAFYNLRLK